MKWYKRFSDFSLSREAFTISPLAHLVYSVICDTVARTGEEGELCAIDIDSPSYLARLCNLRLTTPGELEALWASKHGRREVLTVSVTDAESLSFAVGQCVKVGLLSRLQRESGDVYVVEGFTEKNPIFLNPETRKKRKQRENQEKTGTVPGHTWDSTGQPRSRGEKKRGEEKRREKKSIVDEKPSTVAKTESQETSPIKELTSRLTAAFSEVRKEAYLHQGAKDAVALKRILSFDAAEVERRWRRGLSEADRWLNISTFAQLAQKWNDLGSKAPGTVSPPVQKTKRQDLPKPITMEEFREKIKDQKPYEWNPPTKKKDDEAEEFGLISEATE